jgi:two-component system sensor histidine kinase/response regulator
VSDARKRDRAGAWPFAMTLVVLAAIILGGGTLYYREQERSLRASVDDQLAAVADLKVHELVLWRTERIIDVQHFKDNAAFASLVGEYFARPDDPAVRAALLPWLERMVAGNTYDEIVLVDASSVERLSLPSSAGPLCRSVRSELPAIMRSDSAAFVDFHRDDTDGKVRIALVQPVFAKPTDARAAGAIILRIDPLPLLYPYIQRWPVPSESAETLLVRREGDSVLFLNDLRFDPNAALDLSTPLAQTERPAVKAVLGESGLVSGLDYRGVPVLASIGPVPGSPWFLVAKIDESEAYAPVRRQLLQTTLLIAALLGVAAAGVGVAWRERSASLLQARLAAEEAQAKSASLLASVIDSTSDAIYVKDLEGRYMLFNKAASEMTGRTAEEVLGQDDTFLFPPHEAEVIRSGDRTVIEGGTPKTYDEHVTMADGTLHHYLSTKGPLRDAHGEPYALFGIARDVTDRVRLEEALQETEGKFKYVFDHSIVAKSITLPTGEIQPNDAFCDLLGYTREELADTATWMQVSHPDDVARTQDVIDALISGSATSARFEKRYLRKDGAVVWADLSTSLRRDADGGPLYFMTTIVDITERKAAEAQLKEISARNEAILAAVPEVVAEVDADHVYTWVNEAGRRFFGNDVVGREAADYFLGEQDTYVEVEPLFQGYGDTIYVESWQRRRDGEKRLLAWWCRALTDEKGDSRGALSTARDITEWRAVEDELRQHRDHL